MGAVAVAAKRFEPVCTDGDRAEILPVRRRADRYGSQVIGPVAPERPLLGVLQRWAEFRDPPAVDVPCQKCSDHVAAVIPGAGVAAVRLCELVALARQHAAHAILADLFTALHTTEC